MLGFTFIEQVDLKSDWKKIDSVHVKVDEKPVVSFKGCFFSGLVCKAFCRPNLKLPE